MPTLGVGMTFNMATDRHRTPVGSFYKGVVLDGVKVDMGRQLQAGETLEVNLNQTSFFSLVVQAFSHSSKVIDLVMYTDPPEEEEDSEPKNENKYGESDDTNEEDPIEEEPTPQSIEIKNISMFVCEASNITKVEIINTSSDQHAVIDLIY